MDIDCSYRWRLSSGLPELELDELPVILPDKLLLLLVVIYALELVVAPLMLLLFPLLLLLLWDRTPEREDMAGVGEDAETETETETEDESMDAA